MLYPKIIPLFAPAGCQRSLFKRLCQPKTLSTILANYFRLNSHSAVANFYFEQTELEVCFVASDLVRIEWKGGLLAVSYAIACHDWQEVETKLEQTGDRWTVSTAALRVIVSIVPINVPSSSPVLVGQVYNAIAGRGRAMLIPKRRW